MRAAAIDIGTNTVRYLIAQNGDDVEPIEEGGKVTALGENLGRSGMLEQEAIDRTLTAIEEYAGRARSHNVETIEAIATSAVRDAKNGSAFARAVQSGAGVSLRILSGNDEALLTFLGASKGIGLGTRAALVFDLGGGSTEFIYGHAGRIDDARSVDIGSRRQTAEGATHPVREGVREAIERAILTAVPEFARNLPPDAIIVGVGGTVTTLAAIFQGLERYDAKRVHGFLLTRAQLESMIEWLGSSTIGDLRSIPCLEPGRAEILYAGTVIIHGILQAASRDVITVSTRGILWGTILNVLQKT